MNSRERVIRTLNFDNPDRIPRDLWELPGIDIYQPGAAQRVLDKYPKDIYRFSIDKPKLPFMQGNVSEPGIYVDEWGCTWTNLKRGIIGEIKEPLVKDWSELDKVKVPTQWIGKGYDQVNEICASSDKFTRIFLGTIFERMQWIRGPENLYMDLALQPPEFFKLRDMIFDYLMAEMEAVCKTNVDSVSVNDDWGSQSALLISPPMWRKLFKPLYKQLADKAHAAGKYYFMHSDGYIMDIYEDLIEIGVDAVNSQLFCMPIEEIGQKFAGRITFWGEIDRQHLLVHGSEQEVRDAVERVRNSLSRNNGGVIAQLSYELDTKFENVMAIYDQWQKLPQSRAR
jgi:hypothetical protein